MGISGLRRFAALMLLLGGLFGCALPSPAAGPPLTAAAVKNTLDSWNPNYCKVVEFYGIYKGDSASSQTAYVLIANPSDRTQKPAVYAAQFLLLTQPDGQPRWYLTGVLTHSAGLTRRQGWDNLVIPVKSPASQG